MTNHENYVHYNHGGPEKRGIGVGAMIAIGIAIVFFISIFSLVGTCVGTYNKLIDMEEDVNLAFANVQTQMQSRIEKIPDPRMGTGNERNSHTELPGKMFRMRSRCIWRRCLH